MQRIQLQSRLKNQIFICNQCKKQFSIYFILLSNEGKINCYECIKNNQNLLKQIKIPCQQYYEQSFKKVPLPDIKFAEKFIQELQNMKISSMKVISEYKKKLCSLQQEIQQFYLQTKIICNGYIQKIKLLIEKSSKSFHELLKNVDLINQDKYIRNLKFKYKISLKIQQILNKLKPEFLSIKEIQKKQQSEIKRLTICQVPIQSLVQIKGMMYYGTADGRIIYQTFFDGQLKQIKAHDSLIRSLTYDGQNKLYSGSDDFKIKAWSLQGNQLKFISQFGTVPNFKSYHRDLVIFNKGKTMASTRGQFDSFKIRIWELNTYKNIKQLEGHDNYIRAMNINSNEQIITVSEDKTLKVWDVKNNTEKKIFYHSKKLLNVFCNNINSLIGVVDEDNKILILDDSSLSIIQGWNIGKKILCSNGKNKLYFGVSSQILVYDWNGIKINTFSLDPNFLPCIILELGTNIIVCDGKGKSLEIPLKKLKDEIQ